MKDEPLVSVVVPTKNSEATLEKCLRSLSYQTYSKIELIIIDYFSVDKTSEIAECYAARIFESEAGMSEARNVGTEKAKGDLIFSVDSDMQLAPSVVDECVKKITEGFDAVIIPEFSIGEGFWAKCKALEKACYIGDDTIEAARFLKKKVFESIGGYDSELEAGEDWDLNQRIKNAGYRIGRINASIEHNEGNLTLRRTMSKKCSYGKTMKRYKLKHPNEASLQWRFVRPAFIRNWRKLATDPIHGLPMLYMKACEFAVAWLGALTEGSRDT